MAESYVIKLAVEVEDFDFFIRFCPKRRVDMQSRMMIVLISDFFIYNYLTCFLVVALKPAILILIPKMILWPKYFMPANHKYTGPLRTAGLFCFKIKEPKIRFII